MYVWVQYTCTGGCTLRLVFFFLSRPTRSSRQAECPVFLACCTWESSYARSHTDVYSVSPSSSTDKSPPSALFPAALASLFLRRNPPCTAIHLCTCSGVGLYVLLVLAGRLSRSLSLLHGMHRVLYLLTEQLGPYQRRGRLQDETACTRLWKRTHVSVLRL